MHRFLCLVLMTCMPVMARDELLDALTRLTEHLNEQPSGTQRMAYLHELERVVRFYAKGKVHHDAGQVSLETDGAGLFDRPFLLPAEVKEQDRWIFETHSFNVLPQHLYVYNLRIKGSHTLRLRQVTLYFRDGSHITHDRWKDLEGGNGKAFSRRVYGPPLHAWSAAEGVRTRALERLEIEGSSQDGDEAAILSLLLTIPDPAETPLQGAIVLIERLKQRWQGDVDPATLRADLRALYQQTHYKFPE